MELRGWDYTGRNIGPEFHRQFRIMVEALSDPDFVGARTWGHDLQDSLAERMGMSSSGAVRTVKKICENFGLIERNAFSFGEIPQKDTILTERGEIVFLTAVLEYSVQSSANIAGEIKRQAKVEIKRLYEEIYCDALAHYFYTYSDGTHLCPLRATLKALKKYRQLDKWEWYLLNTFVLHDDNPGEEAAFDQAIASYRSGRLHLTMANVVTRSKGHQYTPQHFGYAGLVHVTQSPSWLISESDRHEDIKAKVLEDAFLSTLYNGGNI